MKKAFTLVEVMILAAIIGLIAAMAVPVHVRLKTNSIAKRVYFGERVSQEEYAYLEQNATMIDDEYRYRRKVETESQNIPEDATPKTIVINGKKYKLVPE